MAVCHKRKNLKLMYMLGIVLSHMSIPTCTRCPQMDAIWPLYNHFGMDISE